MQDLNALLAERKKLDAEIAAQKTVAVGRVLTLMGELGVTPADMGFVVAGAPVPGKRPVKFRDEAGNTWTGVGQRPRWLRARLLEGAELQQFVVKKT